MEELKNIENLLLRIYALLNSQKQDGHSARALTTKEVMERFRIASPTTVLHLFRSKGSPAYKAGKSWMVDEKDFKKFLLKQSEHYKG